MKTAILFFTFLLTPLSPLLAESKAKASIVNGKIQFHANCIQCGGRFVCGATEQNVKLKYLRNYETLSIKEHCYKKSHDISESIRINKDPRTEEAVRYQDYFSQIVLPINENKGGKLLYKQEKGFLYADFFRFLEPTKGLSKSKKKQVISKARKKIYEMKKDRVLLPVVSMEDYRDLSGTRDRIDLEYQEYVKNLLLLHPSELEERPLGTGIFVKAYSVDEKLKSKFAANFGARATGAANLAGSGSGGAPSSGEEKQQGPQKRGIASKPGSDTVELDENLNVINAKKQRQQKNKEQEAASRALLQKALNEQARVSVQKLPNFSTSGFKPTTYSYNRNIQSAYDFIAEINRSGDNSLCDVGATSASQNTIASGSAKVAAAYGADSGLENGSLVAPKIQNTASSALSSSNADECRFKLKSIFNTPEDFRLIAGVSEDAKSAEQVVAKQEREREVGSSLFGGGSRSRSVASVSVEPKAVATNGHEVNSPTQESSSLIASTFPSDLAGDGNNIQTEGGEKTHKANPVKPPVVEPVNVADKKKRVKISSHNVKETCVNNWESKLHEYSSTVSLTCKQWEEAWQCKNTAKKQLELVCVEKFGFLGIEDCLDQFRKVTVRDYNATKYYYKKHPVLKRFTPRRVQDGENISNSLWDTVLLLPENLPNSKELFNAKPAVCALNKSIPRSLFQKNITVFNNEPPGPAISEEQLEYIVNQNPEAKNVLIRVYGTNYIERIQEFSQLNLTCNQLLHILDSDIRQLQIVKNETKKNLIRKVLGNEEPIEELKWDELRKTIVSFNLEMSIRNNGAFSEYHSEKEETKKFLPFSYNFVNNLRKFEKRGCENNKIKPRQTAKVN